MSDYAFSPPRPGDKQSAHHDKLVKAGYYHSMEKEGDGKHDAHFYSRGSHTIGMAVNRKTNKIAHIGISRNDD